MADDKIALSIEIEADRAQMSLGELEAGFEELQTKLKATNRGTEEGRKEFKKLASQMAQTSKEIKNIELSFEGLDREQVASEIGSVAGAVGDLSASLILLSGDNETLQATAQNIEKAMMVSMGLKGAIEGLSSARKLYNNLLRQANEDEKEGIALTVLKTVKEKAAAAGTLILNGVNKLLNTTLKMNPIGLIVIAITAVVAAIVYFKDAIWGLIKTALEPFQFIIDILIDGLQAMGIMASDEANAQEAASLKIIEASKKRREELDKLIEAETRKNKEVIKGIDFELSMRKALGQETADIERKKLKTIIENTKRELELSIERRKALSDEIQEKLKLNKKLNNLTQEEADELTKQSKESLERIKSQKDAILQSSRDLVVFEAQIFKEQQDKISKSIEEGQKKREKASAERKAQREKDKAADEKAAADQKKIDEKAAADAIALEKEKNQLLEDLEAKAIEDKTTRALAELEIAQERERQQLIEKYGLDTELLKALETEQLLQMNTLIADIEQEARENKATLDQEARDKELEADQKALDDKRAQREKDFALATAAVGALSALNDAALATDLLNAAGNDEKQEKIRRASFERQKKLNIAMAAINGAQAVIAGFAQGGLPMAVLAGVTAAAQLAAIVATTYQSSASPTEVEETVPTPDGAGSGGGGVQLSPVTNTSTILGNQQVFVTETDITNTQNNVSVIEESATF
jgi:hypothetical protein